VLISQKKFSLVHTPGQVPPHPSSSPHRSVGSQLGAHSHIPKTQRSPLLHPGVQAQVSKHSPSIQTSVSAGQVTSAQVSSMQLPPEQR